MYGSRELQGRVFRRSFVIKKGTSSMEKASELLIEHVRKMAEDLDALRKMDPTIEDAGRAWQSV
jgi:hypothetical protein